MENTTILMLAWIENHLIVLGLLAILSGVGLGTLLTWNQRPAARIAASSRRSAARSGSRDTPAGHHGAGRPKPGYQSRSW
jgi:hypothetical protein